MQEKRMENSGELEGKSWDFLVLISDPFFLSLVVRSCKEFLSVLRRRKIQKESKKNEHSAILNSYFTKRENDLAVSFFFKT